MITVKNLTVEKQGITILKDISFVLDNFESLSIIGNSDSEKSALLNTLNKFIKVPDNTIFFDSTDINNIDSKAFYNLTGTIFENPEDQFLTFSVRDELTFTLENRNVQNYIIEKELKKIVSKFSLENILDLSPQEISGGEKQKVALASILMHNPKFLFLDNAFSMLDKNSQKIINSLLFNDTNSIILSTTSSEEAFLYSKMLVLNKGEIVFYGNSQEIFLTHYKKLINLGIDIPLTILKQLVPLSQISKM